MGDHVSRIKNSIKDFRQNAKETARKIDEEKYFKQTVVGLNILDTYLKKVRDSLKQHHQAQLDKAMIALKRAAEKRNLAKGKLVLKEDFDEHIKPVLEPLSKKGGKFEWSDVDIESLSTPPITNSERWSVKNEELGLCLASLFHNDKKVAVEKVVALEEEKKDEADRRFEEWLKKKNIAQVEEKQGKDREKEEKEQEEQKKQQQSQKAYKEWLRLRRKNQYKSGIARSNKDIPDYKPAHHDVSWYYMKSKSL